MGQRKRTLRNPDRRGRIPADVGWKQNDKGKWVQHTFYLGTESKEAERRLMRLDEFWDRIEYLHNTTQYPDEQPKPEKPTWTKFTLGIALQLAAGELQIPVERGTSDPDGYVTKIHALSRMYPSINFVPADEEAYTEGATTARGRANERMETARWIAQTQGELPPREIATLDPHNLFDAFLLPVNSTLSVPFLVKATTHDLAQDHMRSRYHGWNVLASWRHSKSCIGKPSSIGFEAQSCH